MTCETCMHRVGLTCHRYPPGLIPNQIRAWPTIDLGDHCGEYDWGHAVTAWLPGQFVRPETGKPWWKFWR